MSLENRDQHNGGQSTSSVEVEDSPLTSARVESCEFARLLQRALEIVRVRGQSPTSSRS